MQRQRVTVIGAGFWGRHWIDAVRADQRLELAAVVAHTRATLDRVAADKDLASGACFTDLDAALSSVATDIVVVVSPSALHLDHVRMGLAAGRHVICEKPLAHDWHAACAIADVVHAHPQQCFMVAQTRRFTGRIQLVRELVLAGKIGQVDSISFDHRVNYTGGGYRQQMAFPVLEDMICHHLDALRYITGQEPVSVYAEAWNPVWSQFSGQASNHVLAELSQGARLDYFGSWTARGKLNTYDGTFRIMGSEGALEGDDDRTLRFYPDTGAEQGPAQPLEVSIPTAKHAEVAGVIDHFLTALKSRRQPMCNIDDNLKTFAFNWAVLESCRAGRRVDLTELPPAFKEAR